MVDPDDVLLEPALETASVDLSRKQVVREVGRLIRASLPASVVRFGEGEGRLLVANESDPTSVKVAAKKVRRQTGLRLSHRDVFRVKSLVMHAFDYADIVGIRGSASFNEEHQMWVNRIEAILTERLRQGRAPAYVTHCLVNNDLRDALPSFLTGQPRVSVISCRDVKAKIQAEYGISDVRVYQVPSQHIMRAVDGDYEAALHGVPIWPDFYAELRENLSIRHRGEIFLVGAGLFGKDLCIRIKELGGIALDLGSTLDGFAGKVTRGPNKPPPYNSTAR